MFVWEHLKNLSVIEVIVLCKEMRIATDFVPDFNVFRMATARRLTIIENIVESKLINVVSQLLI